MIVALKRKVRQLALTTLLWRPLRLFTQRLVSVDRGHVVISALERRASYGISAILSTEQSPRGFVFASGTFDSRTLHCDISNEDIPSCCNLATDEPTTGDGNQQLPVSNWLVPMHKGKNLVRHSGESSASISKFPTTTRKQRTYDNTHRVRFRYGLHLSERGNAHRPKYLIITLTDVRPIPEDVRYPVDDLAEIADSQLNNTLVVAIQPRTEEAALLSELSNIKLNQRIRELAIKLLAQYRLPEASLIFYATGRSAVRLTHVSRGFHGASSLLIPASHAPCLLGEFNERAEDNVDRLEQHLPETLNIERLSIHPAQHVFCTKHELDRMMQSADAAPSGLETRFYICEHAKRPLETSARPSAIALLRALISDAVPRLGEQVTELRLYPDSNYTGVQIRIDQSRSSANGPAWFFLTTSKGWLVHWSLTSHQLPFVKYTNTVQRIDDYSIAGIDRVMGAVSFDVEHGVKYHGLNLRTHRKNSG